MTHAYFFGYGSLVDQRTHEYTPTRSAEATGWARTWCATPDRDLCFLTAIRDSSSSILGLVAPVPDQDWSVLDDRESAYERHEAREDIDHPAASVAIYSVADHRRARPSDKNPILLSYLDVVIHGYLKEFGEEGAAHFFATTHGWHAPILNDRSNPIYPRSQRLGDATRQTVDGALAQLGSSIIDA